MTKIILTNFQQLNLLNQLNNKPGKHYGTVERQDYQIWLILNGRLGHFGLNYIQFIDQFLIDVTDLHNASSSNSGKKKTPKKQKGAHEVIASAESRQYKNIT